MNRRITALIILPTICLAMSGCLFDSSSDTIRGRYKVVWIDVPEQQFICEESSEHSTSCSVLVPEYVFAVGYDDDFIIAKQHPTSGFEDGFKIDPSVTHYYIIDTRTTEEKVIGPLTEEQFDKTKKELRIERIEFDKTYIDIP